MGPRPGPGGEEGEGGNTEARQGSLDWLTTGKGVPIIHPRPYLVTGWTSAMVIRRLRIVAKMVEGQRFAVGVLNGGRDDGAHVRRCRSNIPVDSPPPDTT